MSTVLNYLRKGYEFFEEEKNSEEKRTLLSLESGDLNVRWNDARGHCHKIINIYKTHLNKWFTKALDPLENEQMADLFYAFEEVESAFLYNLNELTIWLAEVSEETLDLVEEEKFDEANTKIRTARKDVLPLRKEMTNAMKQMLDLQAELILITEHAGASG